MMAELLKNQIDKVLQKMPAANVQKTLFVLKGISMEDVDPENAAYVDLEKLMDNKLGYFFEFSMKQRRFMTYEEFLLLGDFAVVQYDTIYILNNNLFMDQYPLALPLSADHINGLLSHFQDVDGETDDEKIIAPADLTGLFIGMRSCENGFIGTYCDDKLPQSSKIIEENIFRETDQRMPSKETDRVVIDLLDEADYVSIVRRVLDDQEEKIIRITSYSGDLTKLNGRLQILAEYSGNLYILQAKTAAPSYEHRDEYTQILRQYWKNGASFRDIPVYDMVALEEGRKEVVRISQECVISDIVQQVENCAEKGKDYRDIFVTASTGSGKSAMFQIPAIYLAEKYNLMTIVVSPLISLMNDQIIGLEKRGYTKAKTLNSDISPIIKEEIRQKVADGEYHILYLSPETLLARSDVEQLIGDRTIGMIVIDEAHIVTTWGKQFRPDYWYLGDHIRRLRKRQQEQKGRSFVISTFTATAIYRGPEDMYQETINSLQMLRPITYLGYVKRDDISIVIEKDIRDKGSRTEYEPDKFKMVERLVQRAILTNQKTLIYFPTIKLIDRCYNQLYIDNMTAQVCTYHGALNRNEKQENYHKFYSGEKLVMLATKAFGMGVDISDIAIVAHFAPTGNVCDYVQEIGRAARDPAIKGEAYYQYNTHDFKHINTLHGLSRVQKYQLIEVIRKIVDLYDDNLRANRDSNTRKRNAMLLDAENFSYIFESPMDDQDDSINKVKTALLMIQKDFEGKFGYSPIRVRPIPLFSQGYFRVEPFSQRRLQADYPGCLKEIDSSSHVCRVHLEKIWKAEPVCSKHSFPQFKYLLYSHSEELELNKKYTLTPALCVSLNFQKEGHVDYSGILSSLKAFINRKVIDNKHPRIEEIAESVATGCKMSRFRAKTICEVVLSSMQTWQMKYYKGINPAIFVRHDLEGRATYEFKVSVGSYFNWLDRHYDRIRREGRSTEQSVNDTETRELYLINDGSTLVQETAAVLGVLEALNVISFKMIGGANSQIYIYINQIQTLRNILKKPWAYENRLLDAVVDRHIISVKMMTYLFENDFTSQERWDMLEDYFLGMIPEKVQKACEFEKAKKLKIPAWDD